MEALELSGRKVVAFVEQSEYGSNRILAIQPIPADGAKGFAFSENDGCIDVWGIESDRGKRIAEAYGDGRLPTNDVDELNRILRPDEFTEQSCD